MRAPRRPQSETRRFAPVSCLRGLFFIDVDGDGWMAGGSGGGGRAGGRTKLEVLGMGSFNEK